MKKNKLLSFICSVAVMLSVGGMAGCFDDIANSSSDSLNSSVENSSVESPDSSTEKPDDSSSEKPDDSSSEKPDDKPTETIIANVPEKFELKLSAIDEATKAADYYLNGVTASKGEESVAVTVDLSKVDFTKAGEYEITYSVTDSDVTETSVVRIYDLPVITAESEMTSDWFMATEESALVEKITSSVSAVDSFATPLIVSVAGEFTKNSYGFYGAGAYSVMLTATDAVGNVATKEVTFTLTNGFAPEIANVAIDLSNIAVAITDYEVFVDFDLYAVGADGLVKLTNKEVRYDVNIGGTVFTADYVSTLAAAGETEFVVVLSNAYTTVKATVTDNQAPAFSYAEESSFAYIVGEEFALPQATKDLNSAQAIEVKYTLNGEEYTAAPTEAGEYTYAIEFYRGEEKVLAKEYNIVLVENYGWSKATLKATENGNIALQGGEGDVNPALSAEYIAAQGEYNTIVVKAKVLQESSNQADTSEATGPSMWYIDGSTFALTGEEKYIGVSKDSVAEGAEITLTLRVEVDGTATFILRNFDGWLEIEEIEFLYLDAKLAAQQKLNTGFPGWDYVHHNDPSAYVDGKTYHIKGDNFTLTNLLVSDAIAAGYKYVTLRIKMTNTVTPIEEIYFTTLESGYNWDYYWASFVGNEVVVRFDLSKYFDSSDLVNAGSNVVQFKGRYIGGADIGAENMEVELIGFETAETADCFVSVPMGSNYTVTGATYAKAVDGSATFAIAANENYAIVSVTAKDATVTDNGDGTYTVSGVTKDTYLEVATKKTVHTVTLAESEMYTADKYSVAVKEGESCTFTITANEGFEIKGVSADNATLTDNGDGTYTVSNVTSTTVITVSAQAEKSEFAITLAAGEHYTASFTNVTVAKDSEYSFTVTANEGYEISSVTADNATVTASGNSYTLTNILNDTIVTVTAIKQVNLAEKMLASEGDFWNYFHFGAWGTNTWDGKSVNVTTSNIQIQKAFIDDALAQGYTHAKISVGSASSDIKSVVMITDGSLGWNYYWKSYNGNSADVRIDLSTYAGKDYSTLTIEFRNSAGAGTDSSVTVTGVEFFKSQETTSWTKTNNNVYAAYENGKLIMDTVSAGGDSGINTSTEWWKKYAVCYTGAKPAIRMYANYLNAGSNARSALWGKNGSPINTIHGNGLSAGWGWNNDLSYTDGDKFFISADKECVLEFEILEWHSNCNEWSGTSIEKVDSDTIKVTALNQQKLFLATYDDYVAAGYTTVTITATYESGDFWVGNDVWGTGTMFGLASGNSQTLNLAEMGQICLFFNAAMSDVEITYTFSRF